MRENFKAKEQDGLRKH